MRDAHSYSNVIALSFAIVIEEINGNELQLAKKDNQRLYVMSCSCTKFYKLFDYCHSRVEREDDGMRSTIAKSIHQET